MIIPPSSIPPYLPSLSWMEAWVNASAKGEKDAEACRKANGLCRLKPRDYSRGKIAEGYTIGIPIEGGSSAIKKLPAEMLRVAEHGRWRQVHLGAFTAQFGKAPYFDYLYPSIREAVEEPLDDTLLSAITVRIHRKVTEMLRIGEVNESLRDADEKTLTLIVERGMELRKKWEIESHPGRAFLPLAMQLGPESLLPLIAPSLIVPLYLKQYLNGTTRLNRLF